MLLLDYIYLYATLYEEKENCFNTNMHFFSVSVICKILFLGVLEEAEFYNIIELIKLIKQKIHDRDNQKSKVGFI